MQPQSDWSGEDWDGEKSKVKEENSFARFDSPRPTMDNPTPDSVDSIPFHGLTIWTMDQTKKASEITATSNPPLTQGTEGKTLKEGLLRLEPIVEEEKQVEQEIREHIEEAKYKLYMGQLSTEDSNLDTDMDNLIIHF